MTWITPHNLKSMMLLASVGAISGSGLLLMIRSSLLLAGQRWAGVFRLAWVLLALVGGFYGCHLITGQQSPIISRR
jgi:hypothetical protein